MLLSLASVGLIKLGVLFAALVEVLIKQIARSFLYAERLELFWLCNRIRANKMKGIVGRIIARRLMSLEWHYAVAVGGKFDWH